MMIKPGITQLDQCVDSRYTLVSMAAKRARMIGTEQIKMKEGKEPKDMKDVHFEKPVSLAVEEIASGKVGYVRSEALRQAERYEKEKYDAISNYVEKETGNDTQSGFDDSDVVFGEDIVEHDFCDDEE